jgi:hypothetical protein
MSDIIDWYGFTWGHVRVTRLSVLPTGHRCLEVSAEGGDSLKIYVSPRGKKIRAFRGGVELT